MSGIAGFFAKLLPGERMSGAKRHGSIKLSVLFELLVIDRSEPGSLAGGIWDDFVVEIICPDLSGMCPSCLEVDLFSWG